MRNPLASYDMSFGPDSVLHSLLDLLVKAYVDLPERADCVSISSVLNARNMMTHPFVASLVGPTGADHLTARQPHEEVALRCGIKHTGVEHDN
jgi:hypothetical protein